MQKSCVLTKIKKTDLFLHIWNANKKRPLNTTVQRTLFYIR